MPRLTSQWLMHLSRAAAVVLSVASLAVAGATLAEAKVGGSSSMGSRGVRTYSAPPPTNTAPSVAAPIQRSTTPQASAAQASTMGARPGFFGSGMFSMRGLLLGGLMGAALAGIFGTGMFASMLGFVLQTALIAFVAMLAWNWFTGRRMGMPAMASAAPSYGSSLGAQPVNYRTSTGTSTTTTALSIGPDDFNTFEQRLGEIQLAYSRGDTGALAELVTPEMLSYFTGDLQENARRGVRNEISEPKLLQGDLAEAWHEVSGEYASVAMKFSLLDRMVDANTGRIVSGSASVPTQSTEIWTFRRPNKGRANQWTLSAIQQTN